MKSRFDFSEPPRTIEIVATQKIAVGKVLVVFASITALAANVTAVLFDGADASGVVKQRLSVVPNMTVGGDFKYGELFDHGLFVVLAGAGVSLTISYYIASENEGSAAVNGSD